MAVSKRNNSDVGIARHHKHGSSCKEELEYLTQALPKILGNEYKPPFLQEIPIQRLQSIYNFVICQSLTMHQIK